MTVIFQHVAHRFLSRLQHAEVVELRYKQIMRCSISVWLDGLMSVYPFWGIRIDNGCSLSGSKFKPLYPRWKPPYRERQSGWSILK